MSTTFEFRRHSIKDGPIRGVIGPRGYELARAVGERQLRGRNFTHRYCSGLWRTQQTLAAFEEGAGDFKGNTKLTPEHAPIYLMDWPELMPMWQACAKGAKVGKDMLQTALDYDTKLTERAAQAVAKKFIAWMETFDDDVNVLVVGHSPYMELIPLSLIGLQIPSLAECAGFRLDYFGKGFGLDTTASDLQTVRMQDELS